MTQIDTNRQCRHKLFYPFDIQRVTKIKRHFCRFVSSNEKHPMSRSHACGSGQLYYGCVSRFIASAENV